MYTGAFDSPGPGPWELEQTHFTRPMTRWMQAVFPGAQMRGMREAFSRYGALVDTVETLPVQGFAYGRIRPLGAPPDSKGHPPRLVMKALFVLHPEMRRRVHRCADAFERKLWREDMARWDGEWRPEAERQNAALAAVEPSALDDDALRAHLRDARTRLEHAMYRHHSLNVTCGLPVGDFIAHAAAWTGKPLSSLLGLLTGSSPVSVGAAEEMTRLVCALRAAPDAAALFASDDDAAATLERLRTWTGEVGAAARAYLDKVGLRLLSGYDVGDYYALEVPIVLVRAIRASLENAALPQTNRAAERLAEIRDAVPADRRADFDALLEEARFVNRLRDERGYLNDAPASGIARRALLEAGRRLADRGRLHATDHALDLSPEEVDALLAGLAGPSADDIAAASHWRATKTHACCCSVDRQAASGRRYGRCRKPTIASRRARGSIGTCSATTKPPSRFRRSRTVSATTAWNCNRCAGAAWRCGPRWRTIPTCAGFRAGNSPRSASRRRSAHCWRKTETWPAWCSASTSNATPKGSTSSLGPAMPASAYSRTSASPHGPPGSRTRRC